MPPPSRLGFVRRTATDAVRGVGFLTGLVAHLRHPVSIEAARAAVRTRLASRETELVALVREAIYADPTSPYRALLIHAGCEPGDLEALVLREGVEGALGVLFRAGVYLTDSELKGAQPVVRGGVTLRLSPARIRTRLSTVPATSVPGRADRRRTVPLREAFFPDLTVDPQLALHARGPTSWRHALWGWPSDGAVLSLTRLSGPGFRPVRWFSRITAAASGFGPKAVGIAWLVPGVTRACGVPLPAIEPVPLEEPAAILDWMQAELRRGATPHLVVPSAAGVSLCSFAARRGIELRGAQITLTSEPVTPWRAAVVARTGAAMAVTYGAKETGQIAHGCLAPAGADKMHLYRDSYALVCAGADGARVGLPSDALLVTGLRRAWPNVVLNVALGDRATVTARECGCPLRQVGWTTLVHDVRSFQKLKLGGLPIDHGGLVRLLDDVLPRRFGGGPGDYQLTELVDDLVDGQPRIRLHADPRLGPLDEAVLYRTVLEGVVGLGIPVTGLWRAPTWFSVDRRPPVAEPSGKILHVHRAASRLAPRNGPAA